MTGPLYLPRPSRTRMLGAKTFDRAGSPDPQGYRLDLQYLLWRISTVTWEDIDPDEDPTTPPKPAWHYTHRDEAVIDSSVIDLTDRSPEWERASWGTKDDLLRQQVEQQALEAAERQREAIERMTLALGLGYSLEDNWDRLLDLEASLTRHKSGKRCWIAGQRTVSLRNLAGKSATTTVKRAMWVLEHGEIHPETSIRLVCGTKVCCRPSHLEER